MNTPKNQKQSTTLSTTKKETVRGLKNVLIQPQEVSWPILKDEKEKSILHKILTELLSPKKCSIKVMSWAKLCRLSKEERLALKKNSQVKFSEEINDPMTAVVLGINCVTKALERKNVCSVLIDVNVEPLFLVKHIVVMCKNENIPVLLVPFLKTVTLNKIGFACAALGIKKSVSEMESEHFYKLHEKIVSLVNTFPKAKTPHQLFDTTENEIDTQLNVKEKYLLKNYSNNCNSTEKIMISNCVYKYRSSYKERAFIPPDCVPIPSVPSVNNEKWSEFIAFSADDDIIPMSDESPRMFKHTGRYMDIHKSNEESSPESKSTSNTKAEENIKRKLDTVNNSNILYVPLKVKRIQGNPKRLKATKIAKSKNKVSNKK